MRHSNPRTGPVPPSPAANDAEAWLRLYGDHRDPVRAELEAAGLPTLDAERLIGAVFVAFAADGGVGERPVGDVLRGLARRVAAGRGC